MTILGRAETMRRIHEARELTATASAGTGSDSVSAKVAGKSMPVGLRREAAEEGKDLAWMGSLAPATAASPAVAAAASGRGK